MKNMKKITTMELSGNKAANLARAVLEVNRQVWLTTYQNDSLGITLKDIESKFTDFDEEVKKNKKYYLENKDRKHWFAFDKSKLVGYCLAQIEDGVGKINSIYILKKYQHLGIGSKMLKKSLKYMKGVPIEIECAVYNTPTIKFYEKFGFKVIGEKKEKYTFPTGTKMTLVRMRKDREQCKE